MAECAWCDKSLPGDAIPACGSCLLRPSPQETEKAQTSEERDVDNLDLTYLDDESGKKPSKRPKGKSTWEVRSGLVTMVHKEPTPLQENVVKRMKLKSNYLRDRNYFYSDLLLHFDGDGVAQFPEAELETIKKLMRDRPGRFWLVEDDVAKTDSVEDQLEKARNALVELQKEEDKEAVEPVVEEESAAEIKVEESDDSDRVKAKPVPKKKKKNPGRKKLTTK